MEYRRVSPINKKFRIISALLCMVLAGCTVVSTPVKTGESRYRISIEYGLGVSQSDIDRRLEQAIQEVKRQYGHKDCGYSIDAQDNFNKKSQYIIICDN